MSHGSFDEDEYDDYRTRDRSHDSLALAPETILSWGTARAGLGMNVVGGIFMVVGFGLLLFFTVISNDGGPFGRDGFNRNELAEAIGPIATLLAGVGGLISLLGMFLSGGSSSESGARGWSYGTRILLFVFAFTLLLLMVLIEERLGNGERGQVVLLVLVFELAALALCWMMYLRQIAAYTESYGIAANAVVHLIVSELILSLFLLMIVTNSRLIDARFFTLIGGMTSVGMMIWQVTIVSGTRAGLTQFLIKNMARRR